MTLVTERLSRCARSSAPLEPRPATFGKHVRQTDLTAESMTIKQVSDLVPIAGRTTDDLAGRDRLTGAAAIADRGRVNRLEPMAWLEARGDTVGVPTK